MKVVILILTFVYVVTISGCNPINHGDEPDPAQIEELYDDSESDDYYDDQETSEDHFNLQEKREMSAKLQRILEKVGKIFEKFFL